MVCDKVSKAGIELNNMGVTDNPNESGFRNYKEGEPGYQRDGMRIEHFQVWLANRENVKDDWLLIERLIKKR